MGAPEVTLTAIVRDEMVNPAGGIQDFLDKTLPYVHEAVIVDTGSVDGTRELLDRARSQYPHLRVVDHAFDGYASSRNVGLKHVRTEYALVLDADERIRPRDLRKLPAEIAQRRLMQYDLQFMNVWHVPSISGRMRLHEERGKGHNPRLFSMEGNPHFVKELWEYLIQESTECDLYPAERRAASDAVIFHYLGTRKGRGMKDDLWYSRIARGDMSLSPSQVAGSHNWKQVPETKLSLFRRLQSIFF